MFQCPVCGNVLVIKKTVAFFGLKNTHLSCPYCGTASRIKNTKTSFLIGFSMTLLSFTGITVFFLEKEYGLFLLALILLGASLVIWVSLSKFERIPEN